MATKPKCPEYVYVGRHPYTVVQNEGPFLASDNSQLVNGECHFNSTEVRVNTDQSPSMVKDTVMHEVLHAVGYDIGAQEFQTLAAQEGFDLEEYMVSRWTPALITLLADNPELVRWVTSER